MKFLRKVRGKTYKNSKSRNYTYEFWESRQQHYFVMFPYKCRFPNHERFVRKNHIISVPGGGVCSSTLVRLREDVTKYDNSQLLTRRKRFIRSPSPSLSWGGGYSFNGLYGEAPPERGTFFSLQVYERVGISQV